MQKFWWQILIYGARVRVDSMAKIAELDVAEKQKMKDKVQKIIAHGINCFINRQLTYNYPEELFADAGILAIEHADFEGIERLALVTGGEIASTFDNPETVKLGHCNLIEEIMIGEDKLIHFSGVELGQACTVVLHGASCVMNEYVKALRELACEILELLAEGLGLGDSEVFSRMIRDSQSDSLLRMNHYPPYHGTTNSNTNTTREDCKTNNDTTGKVGFGEHTDPQILTLLRSNGVPGLQVLPPPDGGVWVPVPPDSTAFCVNVGDLLQAMTNGRLVSARHRAMVCSYSSRLSLVYFSAPPLDTWISPLPEMVTPQSPQRYRSFQWGEYKKAMYALRLGYDRLELFRAEEEDDDAHSKG